MPKNKNKNKQTNNLKTIVTFVFAVRFTDKTSKRTRQYPLPSLCLFASIIVPTFLQPPKPPPPPPPTPTPPSHSSSPHHFPHSPPSLSLLPNENIGIPVCSARIRKMQIISDATNCWFIESNPLTLRCIGRQDRVCVSHCSPTWPTYTAWRWPQSGCVRTSRRASLLGHGFPWAIIFPNKTRRGCRGRRRCMRR